MLFSQCRSNADEHTLTQISKLTINFEITLGHRHWINVILSMLFQRWQNNVDINSFINVETTSANIRRLNFHFQPNFNIETTLVHRRWIDVTLSTSFQRCFANVEIMSINESRLNFHFQRNINVDERWWSNLFQRWFNDDVFDGISEQWGNIFITPPPLPPTLNNWLNWKNFSCWCASTTTIRLCQSSA